MAKSDLVIRRELREWCERELAADAINTVEEATKLKRFLIAHPQVLNDFVSDHLHEWCEDVIRIWRTRHRASAKASAKASVGVGQIVVDAKRALAQARTADMEARLEVMLGPFPSDPERAAAWYQAAGSLSNDELREKRIAAWNTTASQWARWREWVGGQRSLSLPMMIRPQLLHAARIRSARADNNTALANLWTQLAQGLANDEETVCERYSPDELEEIASVTLGARQAAEQQSVENVAS